MAPGRAPDRPRGLPPAAGHPDAARRGTPAHQRAGQRPGLAQSRGTATRSPRNTRTWKACRTAAWTSAPPSIPGQLVIGIRRVDPSVKGVVYHPLTTPWPASEPSPYADWFPAGATIRDPVPVGIIPETGEPMTVTLFDAIGAKAIGVHGATGSGKSTLLNDVRERVTAMSGRRPGAAQRRAHGRRAHLGAAGRGHRLRPGSQRRGRAGQDPRRAGVGAADWSPSGRPRSPRPGTACSSRPRTTRPRPDDRRGGRGGRQCSRLRGDPGVPGVQAAQDRRSA